MSPECCLWTPSSCIGVARREPGHCCCSHRQPSLSNPILHSFVASCRVHQVCFVQNL
ncbi:hypothetical protein BCR37DRAFT_67936 [Protomyces lactucae-debilis]|uniref:Uncharacterized protein n=1 Tax=Protomyces lactucae-debilis TaxID=2754530 RepID=A0A1Y2F9V0_PROLT|nr:uncharacterized protein BCR37DRAFT_67936 [Protomyces lactucae-debilis]ORY80407.1 hypothetical protein BCR37DRAFT_67936 [Protomyces lactucae-debilis]